jgi:hypothetical protein
LGRDYGEEVLVGVTISVNHPDFPPDTVFAIDHLGQIPNGGSLEVPEENEREFISDRGVTVEDAFAGNEVAVVSGSSSVDNVEELIGDREPPGPAQGVSPKEEEEAPPEVQPEAQTEIIPPPTEGEGT